MTGQARFPFSSVVGQDDAKLALQLITVDPLIGGVLLRGEKGSAKTTLARGLAGLMGPDARFVDLPLGATEDRLIGSLDVAKALTQGEFSFTPGMLAAADGGVLYVDEVNLLADHLVDTLLDVAVSGVNRVEREAISHSHAARFVLIGSMNPEEGELRPQLLDRFGLSVEVRASVEVEDRVQAVQRRLQFDRAVGHDPSLSAHPVANEEEILLTKRLAEARPATVGDDLIRSASELALAVGAEGLRADLVLCRAAAANAGLEGRAVATEDDLRRVAPLVLAHRSRRNPFDPPSLPPEALSDAIDSVLDPPVDSESSEPEPEPQSPSDGSDNGDESLDDRRPTAPVDQPMAVGAALSTGGILEQARRRTVESSRGRFVRDVAPDPETPRPIAVASTVRHLASGNTKDGSVRHAVTEERAGNLLILVVDTSGSMGAEDRARAATGIALGLLTDAYQNRDHVALITFRDDGAEIVLQPTGSIEVAKNRLGTLATGGPTPLAAGLRASLDLARKATRRDAKREPLVVLLTDGRATGSEGALADAIEAAGSIAKANVAGLVLDCEQGSPRLGLAPEIADAMNAPWVTASDLAADQMTSLIRSRIAGGDA